MYVLYTNYKLCKLWKKLEKYVDISTLKKWRKMTKNVCQFMDNAYKARGGVRV